MSFENTFLSFTSLVLAQIIFYEISSKQALRSCWFLSLFYLLVFTCVQGLVIFCRLFSIAFFVLPILSVMCSFFLGRGLKRIPQFQKKYFALPNFYFFSSLWLSLIWSGYLSDQAVLNAKYNLIEGFVWSWFLAVLFPILAGIKERLELTDLPSGFSSTGLLMVAAGFILLALSFF